jgi:hypothetical protein
MEFEALGGQLVLKNIKGAIYNEAKRQAASLAFQTGQLRDRRERNAELAWRALFVSMAAALIGIMGVLMALH